MKKKPNLPAIIIAGAIVVVVGGIFLLASRPGQYDNLAQCLTDKGAKFYGAFWCSHCQEQKAEFGKSAKLLPYVECASSDSKSQLPVCDDAQILGYPTWVFPDGTRAEQALSLEELANKTDCPLY